MAKVTFKSNSKATRRSSTILGKFWSLYTISPNIYLARVIIQVTQRIVVISFTSSACFVLSV